MSYDYSNLTTRELLEKALNGEIPIPQRNTQTGEEEYIFMKAKDDPYASLSDAEVINVPNGVDPYDFRNNNYQSLNLNPFAANGRSILAMMEQKDELDDINREMKELGYPRDGTDKYAHCKAHYKASSFGPMGYLNSQTFGLGKEVFDVAKKTLFNNKLKFPKIIEDSEADLKANSLGRQKGINDFLYNNPLDPQKACEPYRVKGIPSKY